MAQNLHSLDIDFNFSDADRAQVEALMYASREAMEEFVDGIDGSNSDDDETINYCYAQSHENVELSPPAATYEGQSGERIHSGKRSAFELYQPPTQQEASFFASCNAFKNPTYYNPAPISSVYAVPTNINAMKLPPIKDTPQTRGAAKKVEEPFTAKQLLRLDRNRLSADRSRKRRDRFNCQVVKMVDDLREHVRRQNDAINRLCINWRGGVSGEERENIISDVLSSVHVGVDDPRFKAWGDAAFSAEFSRGLKRCRDMDI